MLRAAMSEGARLERVRLVGDDGAGKFGMDADRPRRLGAPRRPIAAPRAARPPRVRRLERPRRRRARRPRRRDRPVPRGSWPRWPGTTVRLVDAGGGLGIPYEAHEESLDLARFGRGVTDDRGRLAGRPAPGRGASAARAGPVPRRAGGRIPGAGRRPQDRRRLDGRRPRWRRPPPPPSGPGRPGAPDPRAVGTARSRHRPGASDPSRWPGRCAPGWTSSASTRSSPRRRSGS